MAPVGAGSVLVEMVLSDRDEAVWLAVQAAKKLSPMRTTHACFR